MTAALKEGIFTKLSADAPLIALVGDRIYPDVADQKKKLPYIVYEVDSEQGVPHMTGGGTLELTSVQFTVWATSSASRSAVNDALRTLLDHKIGLALGSANTRSIRKTNGVDTQEKPDAGNQNWIFGTFNDYDIWYFL